MGPWQLRILNRHVGARIEEPRRVHDTVCVDRWLQEEFEVKSLAGVIIGTCSQSNIKVEYFVPIFQPTREV